LACPETPVDCGSTSNKMWPASVTGTGPFSYEWSVSENGWTMTGAIDDTVIYTAGTDSGFFKLVITDESNGCVDSCWTWCYCAAGDTFCTYTMGGWGSKCPRPQVDDSMSTQPGCIRDHFFDDIFPDGVRIGDPDGPDGYGDGWYTALWDSASDVQAFLPSGMTPGIFTRDYTNRTYPTTAGVLAGQLLALRLNVEYSCNSAFAELGLTQNCLRYWVIPADSCFGTKFAGMTVGEFQAIADSIVGNFAGVAERWDVTPSQLNEVATCLNETFDECGTYGPAPPDKRMSRMKSSAKGRADLGLPKEYSVEQSYPNPFNPTCEILYALPTESQVTLSIYNILGQKVRVLVDEYQSAGYKSASWDGRDNNGAELASGVYFYRIEAGSFVQTKKMVLMR
jgi:hypothetical protein